MDGNNNGWMASLSQWTWVWAGSRSWWWTGKPGVLQFMGLQRVGHDWATELNWQKQLKFISHSSGGWKSVIIVPECLGSGESPLMGCRHLTSCFVLTWQKERALVSSVPYNLIHTGSPSLPNHYPKAPYSNTITLGIRISIYEYWGNTNIQSVTYYIREQMIPVLLLGFLNLILSLR